MDSIKTFPKFSIFFLFIMCLEVAGLTVIPTFHQVSKALIMASLVGFYISEERRQNNVFLMGMIFALFGDVFFLWDNDTFFKIGMVSFSLMQLCYILTFNKKRRIAQVKNYIVPVALVLIGLGVIAFLWPTLGDMQVFAAFYILLIVAMSIIAYLRHPKLRGYEIMMIGVVLFILSDGLLVVNKFVDAIPYGQIIVMVLYMLAQYFIVTSEVLGAMPRVQNQEVKKVDSNFVRHKHNQKK